MSSITIVNNETNRKYWLDTLRGLAMLFVVLVHESSGCARQDLYNVFIGPIMLPLFFAITGYLFKIKNGTDLSFYKNLFFKLILPWILLSLIWARLFLIPIKGFHPYYTTHLWNFISGEKFWYLPCCILAEIIQFYVQKLIKDPKWVCIADVILCAIGFALAYFQIGNFMMLNRAFIAQFYLMLGYILRNFEGKFNKIKWSYLVCALPTYIILGIVSALIFPYQYLDVHTNTYPSILICITMIIIGVFTLFITFQKFNFSIKWLTFIGQNSLFYYMIHSYVMSFIRTVASMIGIPLPQYWILAIIQTILTCILCGIGAILVNRFLPFVVGKKRVVKTL